MKGSNSRFSHRPGQRYSTLVQIQGGMVTDADLAEAGQIGLARSETLADSAAGSGAPARGGAVSMAALSGGGPSLVPGLVFAEGKLGVLAAAEGATPAGALDLMTMQVDLPFAPAVPGGRCLIYADLWERPIFPNEDPDLTDAGLHGAETSYRSRTMVQLKAAPAAADAALDQLATDLAEGQYPFQRRGDAVADVTEKAVEIPPDEDSCDPCAEQVKIEAAVPNALFRVEVIAVVRSGAAAPTSVTLAWSFENASAIADAALMTDQSARDAFARPQAVYEFFSVATDAHVGVFAVGATQRPKLQETLNPPPGPGTDNGGDPYPFVRRWDGAATIDLATGTPSGEMGTGRFAAAADGSGRIELGLDGFSFLLDYAGRDFLPGDHWLVELRRFAAQNFRARLAPAGADRMPLGPVHHFCPLFRVQDGEPLPLSEAERRRLSFPALADLPATHVAYRPACPGLYDDAETVAEALDALCDLDATEVAYDPGPDCERFAGATTVAEALGRLCRVEADDALTRVLRLMMDWGVVCGVRVSLPRPGGSVVTITPGTALDRAGHLIDVPGGDFDLRELADDAVHGDLSAILQREDLCLAVALDDAVDVRDRGVRLHLAPRSGAFGPLDRTFEQAVAACVEGRKPVRFGDKFQALDADRAKIASRVVSVWINKEALSGVVALPEADRAVADAFIATLVDDFKLVAEPEQGARVERLMAQAEQEINVGAVTGEIRDRRRMQLAATKLGILAVADEERLRDCQCANALPPCAPAAGEPPYLVPIGCLRSRVVDNRPVALTEVCDVCCRKQAATWRSSIYYTGHPFADRMQALERLCCHREPDPPRGDLPDWLDRIRDHLYPRKLPEMIPILPDWPPRPPHAKVAGRDDLVINPALVQRRPDVVRLNPADARDILTGNGFEVVETIDLAGAGALGRIEALAGAGKLLNATPPEPGDKVALLTRDGAAAEFVLVQKGAGRLPFETATEKAAVATQVEETLARIDFSQFIDRAGVAGPGAALPGGGLELGVIEGRIAELDRMRIDAEAGVAGLRDEVAALETRRGQVVADAQAASDSLLAATAARERLGQEVAELDGQMRALASIRAATETAVGKARGELAAIQEEHVRVIDTMRRAQPVDTIVTDVNLATALRAQGVLSVGDLDAMPAATVRRLEADPTVGAGQATRLKTLANTFLRR